MHQDLLINNINKQEVEKASMFLPKDGTPICKSVLFIGKISSFTKFRSKEFNYITILANNIYEARFTLLSGFFNEKSILPEAIVCDTNMAKHELIHFAGFLANTSKFKCIPIILIEEEKQFTDSAEKGCISGVDDIIQHDATAEDLIYKIKVLAKYKCLKSRFPYHTENKQKKNFNFQSFMSRVVDVVAASVFILLFLPLFVLIAIAIKIDSRGSVFYTSLRAGKGYKVFKFYKFRTMIVDADKKIEQIRALNQYKGVEKEESVFFKIDQDPRVTMVGRFLRNTSLDELPQLINVLLGDMSIVGNRPLPLYEASALTIDEAAERFLAPAGITGLWQIKERGQVDVSARERINLDIEYAKRQSFLYDMQILIKTPMSLKQKTNV